MTHSVAVLSAIPRLTHYLRLAMPNLVFSDVTPDKDDTLLHLSKAEILVADANLLIPYVDNLPKTKWVQATWAGLENLMLKLQNKNIPYTITRFSGPAFGYLMSEYVVSQIVNFERDQKLQYENQKNCVWDQGGKFSNYRRLSDLKIGILGLGEIGSFIAKTLKNFGATVWGMSRSEPREKKDYLDRHVTTGSLSEILKNCDYVINVMPSTEATKGLLNGNVLKDCSEKKSVFINIGRGSIIKETDLVNALENEWISGAILDVFEKEPLDKNSKLWKLPQVVISPHISGVSRADDIASVFAENYTKYIKGEPLKNVIDISRGY